MQREVKKAEKVNLFTIYLPKKATIKRADTLTVNTELIIKLPENSKAFFTTKFEGQRIQRIIEPKKERLSG